MISKELVGTSERLEQIKNKLSIYIGTTTQPHRSMKINQKYK